jgi:hypothetical protein
VCVSSKAGVGSLALHIARFWARKPHAPRRSACVSCSNRVTFMGFSAKPVAPTYEPVRTVVKTMTPSVARKPVLYPNPQADPTPPPQYAAQINPRTAKLRG